MEHAYTTSWGMTTRMIGAMIMAHSDDDGLRLPPRVAPYHVVIIPILTQADKNEAVLAKAESIRKELSELPCFDRQIKCHIDSRDIRAGEKSWEWVKKGVPIRIEIGPKDLESGSAVVSRRDQDTANKHKISFDVLSDTITKWLPEMQKNYFEMAKAHRDERKNDRDHSGIWT